MRPAGASIAMAAATVPVGGAGSPRGRAPTASRLGRCRYKNGQFFWKAPEASPACNRLSRRPRREGGKTAWDSSWRTRGRSRPFFFICSFFGARRITARALVRHCGRARAPGGRERPAGESARRARAPGGRERPAGERARRASAPGGRARPAGERARRASAPGGRARPAFTSAPQCGVEVKAGCARPHLYRAVTAAVTAGRDRRVCWRHRRGRRGGGPTPPPPTSVGQGRAGPKQRSRVWARRPQTAQWCLPAVAAGCRRGPTDATSRLLPHP